MAPLDVVQAEAEVAARTEQLVVSRYNRRITEQRLKKLLSSRLDPGVIAATIVPTSAATVPPAPPDDLSQAILRAMEIRPEVKQALLDQENKKINMEYTRNQLRPTLDLVASYSQNGLGGNRILRDYSQGIFGAPIVDIESGGFWNAVDSLFSRKYLGYTLGFNFSMPLGNNEARGNNAQAQIDFNQGEERLRSLRQRIALEVREARDNMEMNRARAEAAEVTVRYEERRLQGEQDKYSLGATTTRFIIEAQRDLEDAQSRRLKARIDLIKSRVAFDKAVGDTLAVHGIEMKELQEQEAGSQKP
jgi:outer membrane protein TolC